MAWTAPKTWAANDVLTAQDLNEQIRDNLLQTMPAKATTAGGYFVTSGENEISERFPVWNRVNASEGTSSTSYTDLTTIGPTVTFTSGTNALVFMSAEQWNSATTAQSTMSWAISGATTRAAGDQTALVYDGGVGVDSQSTFGGVDLLTTLTPGVNTITLKYRASAGGGGGTAKFGSRFLAVIPL